MRKDVQLIVAGTFGLALVLGILAVRQYFKKQDAEDEYEDFHRNFYLRNYDDDGGYEFQAQL